MRYSARRETGGAQEETVPVNFFDVERKTIFSDEALDDPFGDGRSRISFAGAYDSDVTVPEFLG